MPDFDRAMQAMIFAAGMGTRLRPLTDTMPKALVPLCGKPLLEHLLLKMKAAGFREVVINVHHFAGMIRAFIEEKDSWGMKIRFSDETDLLRDTGGGIRHAAPLFDPKEPVLVHNVDIVSNLDLKEFYSFHRPDSLATLLVSARKTSRYLLFDKRNCLAAWMNASTGEVKSPFPELKRSPGQLGEREDCIGRFLEEYGLVRYAFAGVHVISPRIFGLMEDAGEVFSIIDFYLSVADRFPVRAFPFPGLDLVDVGKTDSLKEAEDRCLRGDFRIAPGPTAPDK